MLAALSVQLCDMLCCVLKIGHKLKFHYGICFLWNDGLHLKKEIGRLCLILIGLLLRVLWKRPKEDIFFATKQSRSNKNRLSWKTYTVLVLISHGSLWMKNLMRVTFGWNVCWSAQTAEIWKGNFEFCSFGSSSRKVYYHAVHCICRVCTKFEYKNSVVILFPCSGWIV